MILRACKRGNGFSSSLLPPLLRPKLELEFHKLTMSSSLRMLNANPEMSLKICSWTCFRCCLSGIKEPVNVLSTNLSQIIEVLCLTLALISGSLSGPLPGWDLRPNLNTHLPPLALIGSSQTGLMPDLNMRSCVPWCNSYALLIWHMLLHNCSTDAMLFVVNMELDTQANSISLVV